MDFGRMIKDKRLELKLTLEDGTEYHVSDLIEHPMTKEVEG